jgi:hypothetical protein
MSCRNNLRHGARIPNKQAERRVWAVHVGAQMFRVRSRADGRAAHVGKALRLGCEIDGRGEEDAVLEVRGKEVQFESVSANQAAGVLGVGEIETIRRRVLWGGCPIAGVAPWAE